MRSAVRWSTPTATSSASSCPARVPRTSPWSPPPTTRSSAARSLRDDGTVHRAWLGVRAVDLSPAEAKLLDVSGGATLSEVTEGSPAAKAELAVGDVITELDGQEISGASDLVVALRSWTPGDEVAVTWRRGTDEGQVTVTLGG